MENPKVEKFYLDSGLEAEKHISESGDNTVIEFYVEEARPKTLQKRITEKRKNIVAERTIESIENNEVIDVQVESLEPQVKPQLVEHIRKIGPVVANTPEDNVTSQLQELRTMVEGLKEYLSKDTEETATPTPIKAYAAIEERVNSSKTDSILVVVLIGAIIAATCAWIWF